ncbi:MAG: glutamine--fructose-6-phosphate transaminase (isomerizing) [Patescibacteria group bacterium]
MCGVFAFTSSNKQNPTLVLEGLKRLEYRGYDSWGIAVLSDNTLEMKKNTGPLNLQTVSHQIKNLPESNLGLGHIRWATHGKVNVTNAHPHTSLNNDMALVHNGIVENYEELKKVVKKQNLSIKTETDSEIIMRLIEIELKKTNTLAKALANAFKHLKGRNTIILITNKGELVGIKNGSPLVIGINDDGYYFGSDTLSFGQKTKKALILDNFEMAYFNNKNLEIYNINSLVNVKKSPILLNQTYNYSEKSGYKHYMLKEIYEQSKAIVEATSYSKKELTSFTEQIKESENIYTIGAGTASYAAGQIAFYLREYAGIKAIELKAYEIESYKKIFTKKDLVIAASQSGESADTIEALEIAKNNKAKIASIVNMQGSTISRMSDFPFYLKAGPEICVLSTKSYTSKLSWGYIVAKHISKQYEQAQKNIVEVAESIEKYLSDKNNLTQIKNLAKKLIKVEHAFVLGRGQNFYTALETALKVKEVSYKHFEAFSAGELKHGVIALVENNTPVICHVSEDDEKANMLSAAQEVKARGAVTIQVGNIKSDIFDYSLSVPESRELAGIANIIPIQLLSYYMAALQNLDPDKPRNLAKSVTVK